ncbi:MAG TPA: hypothetical protein VFK94_06420 [Patescibacteria group bacterium]|nr:hypothetical protein [Patescibacteria group bacterium]
MAVYVCTMHPYLGFYIKGVRHKFAGGEFDTESLPKDLQDEANEVLRKLVDGTLGVVEKPTVKQPFQCEVCLAGFPNKARYDGHKSKHKTQAQIDAESVREGQRVTTPEG